MSKSLQYIKNVVKNILLKFLEPFSWFSWSTYYLLLSHPQFYNINPFFLGYGSIFILISSRLIPKMFITHFLPLENSMSMNFSLRFCFIFRFYCFIKGNSSWKLLVPILKAIGSLHMETSRLCVANTHLVIYSSLPQSLFSMCTHKRH